MTTSVPRRTSRDIRSDSRLDVLHAVLSVGVTTRNEVVRATGLSQATVATVVAELIGERILVEQRQVVGKVGRPTANLQLNPERGYVVGIDVAETYMRAVLFDTALHEVASVQESRDEHDLAPALVVETIGRVLDAALAKGGVARDDVLGVGIALPGLVQGISGVSVVVPHWTWHTVELDSLRSRVGLPLVVDNPLKAIATTELWFGKGRSASSMITLNLGTGVGAGIVLERQILRGATNSAGEWGHSLLVMDGRGCRCGRRGCVEAYVGAPGIRQTLREIAPEHPLADIELQNEFVGALAAELATPEPDPAVRQTVERTARYLGQAIADLVAIINPEMVTLTGWTTWLLGDHLLPLARAEVLAQAPGQSAVDLVLEASTERGNMVATGVAMTALERFLGDVGLVTTQVPVAL